jgi:hypothetical protein
MRHVTTDSVIDNAERSELAGLTEAGYDHLEKCPKCFVKTQDWADLFESLRFRRLDAPPEYATRSCITLFQRKAPSLLMQRIAAIRLFDSELAPESYGIRGASHARQIRFCGGDADVHIRVSANGTRITGQMLQIANGDFMARTPIILSCDGKAVVTGITDDLGEFRFSLNRGGELDFEAELPSGARLTATIKIKEQQ